MVQVHLPKEIYVRLQGGSAGTCHGVLFGEQWANNVLIKVISCPELGRRYLTVAVIGFPHAAGRCAC